MSKEIILIVSSLLTGSVGTAFIQWFLLRGKTCAETKSIHIQNTMNQVKVATELVENLRIELERATEKIDNLEKENTLLKNRIQCLEKQTTHQSVWTRGE